MHHLPKSGSILTFRVHSVLVQEVEPPILKLFLVLDAGPDEDAFSLGGVDATSLNIDDLDVVDGGCAGATISAYCQQVSIHGSDGVGTSKFEEKPGSSLELTNVHDVNLKITRVSVKFKLGIVVGGVRLSDVVAATLGIG